MRREHLLLCPVDGGLVQAGPAAGVILAVEPGAPVRAAALGSVLFAGWLDQRQGYGVVLQHMGDAQTVYAGLAGPLPVPAGRAVRPSQVIGRAAGPVRFQLRIALQAVDPRRYWLLSR